jgi:hypothetical protein
MGNNRLADALFGILILCFLFAKLAVFSRYHYLIWDEAVYLSMGKWLFSQGAIGLWEIIRPVLFPVVLGWIWSSGLPPVEAAAFFQILVSCGVIVLTYTICAKLFGKAPALISAILLSFFPVFFQNSDLLLVGNFSTLLALLAFYFFLRPNYWLAGIFSGLAFTSRFPQGLLLLVFGIPLGFMALKRDRLPVVKLGAGFLASITPYFLFNAFKHPAETPLLTLFRPLVLASFHQHNPAFSVFDGSFQSQVYNLLYYPLELFMQNPLILFAIAGLFLLYKRKNEVGFITLFMYIGLYLAYFTYIDNKQLRFSLTFLPVLCMLAAYGIVQLLHYTSRLKLGSVWHACFVFALVFFFMTTLAGIRIASNYHPETRPEIVSELYTYFERHPPEGAVMTSDPAFAAYSDHRFLSIYQPAEIVLPSVKEYLDSQEVSHIAFKPSSYFCSNGFKACEDARHELFLLVLKNNPVHDVEFDGKQFVIFEIKRTGS